MLLCTREVVLFFTSWGPEPGATYEVRYRPGLRTSSSSTNGYLVPAPPEGDVPTSTASAWLPAVSLYHRSVLTNSWGWHACLFIHVFATQYIRFTRVRSLFSFVLWSHMFRGAGLLERVSFSCLSVNIRCIWILCDHLSEPCIYDQTGVHLPAW